MKPNWRIDFASPRNLLLGAILIGSTLSSPAAQAQLATYPTFIDFTADQGTPHAITQLGDGSFYGVASNGGPANGGYVFRITPAGVVAILHNFIGPEGATPAVGVLQASDGLLYGATGYGGSSGCGVVFRMATDGSGYTVLHNFTGSDGFYVNSLVLASNGALFGTTLGGGNGYDGTQVSGDGTIFELSTDGSNFSDVHLFDQTDGLNPTGLVEVRFQNSLDVYLYGETISGGSGGEGTIFQMYIDRFGAYLNLFTSLYGFSGPDGSGPNGPLVRLADGNLYGVTAGGGALNGGTVYHIAVNGTGHTLLYSFDPQSVHFPLGGLTQRGNGKLYGTLNEGNPSNAGAVYGLNPDGSAIEFPVVFNWDDGSGPSGTLINASDGNLYGVTVNFSGLGDGSVFVVDFTPPAITASSLPAAVKASGNKKATTSVTVSGKMTDAVSGVDVSTGSYTVTDSAGGTTSGTVTLAADGSYSFMLTLSSYTAKKTTRTYTITVKGKDKQGNAGSASTTFTVNG